MQPVEKTMEKQVVPLQHMKNHTGADIHTAAHGGPYAGAGGYALKEAAAHGDPTLEQAPGRSCCLGREAHAGAGFLAVTAACGRPRLEQLFLKYCRPWRGPTLEQFLKDCILWEGPMLGQGKNVRRKERQR